MGALPKCDAYEKAFMVLYPTHNYVGVYAEYDKRGGLFSNLMVISPQNLGLMLRSFI
jgi:hypothetical protein